MADNATPSIIRHVQQYSVRTSLASRRLLACAETPRGLSPRFKGAFLALWYKTNDSLAVYQFLEARIFANAVERRERLGGLSIPGIQLYRRLE